ncbi:hypothetical protein BRADI_1g35045v3 [Brachypodium distachyon]|uniref:Uncharacterized protein n=1 Tax=Brachypodium distachyon TaxID=15368 RepID=A0A2K2DMR8_BRADI|nr:hypothetical protein BRADI_1g35045v3 [Brachypodium distachyon]
MDTGLCYGKARPGGSTGHSQVNQGWQWHGTGSKEKKSRSQVGMEVQHCLLGVTRFFFLTGKMRMDRWTNWCKICKIFQGRRLNGSGNTAKCC